MCYPHLYLLVLLFFFFNDPATTEIYTLSLHDALPISSQCRANMLPCLPLSCRTKVQWRCPTTLPRIVAGVTMRSEEHTSELQSRFDLVCRLLLEKKKKRKII